MKSHWYLTFPALSLALSWLTSFCLLRWGSPERLLDLPNERSLHDRPISRGGGIGVFSGILAGGAGLLWLAKGDSPFLWILLGALGIAMISFLDDLYSLVPALRISVHFLVAIFLFFAGFRPASIRLPGMEWELWIPASFLLFLLYLAWLVNLYNFMDGMDGFAGGMAVIGFGTFALLGYLAGVPRFAGVNLVIASASAGFLFFNLPPARIFMGDLGSSLLGYLAAAMSAWADIEDVFPLWVATLVFSPFIIDATVTLFRRLFRGERVWRAHKTHFYQRLVQAGWGHGKTVRFEYGLMVGAGASAVAVMPLSPLFQWLVLGAWVLVFLFLIRWVGRLESESRNRRAPAVS